MNKNNSLNNSTIKKGMLWASVASILWGISGTVMQFVSQNEAIPAVWYLSVRTLISGVILIIIGSFKFGSGIFGVFKSKKVLFWLFMYAIFGLAGNMFTFYMSVQTGNAAAATILQYLAPLFIVLGALVFQHKKPLRIDFIVFAIALVGVILSITKGDFHQLAIPLDSLIWGILSGVTAACYVVLPRPEIEAGNSPIVVLGWAMLIDAVFFNIKQPFWVGAPKITMGVVLGIGAIILIGTLGAFLCELIALQFAPSEDVSLVDALQPVATFILSVVFLHLQMTIVEIIGAIMVVYAMYLLQSYKTKLL